MKNYCQELLKQLAINRKKIFAWVRVRIPYVYISAIRPAVATVKGTLE